LGDWWAFGEHKYGERTALVDSENWTELRRQTLMNLASIARAFAPERCRRTLSFRHHIEVVALPADTTDELLDWCEAEDGAKKLKTVRELRGEILRRQAAEKPARNGDPPLGRRKDAFAELQETGARAPSES